MFAHGIGERGDLPLPLFLFGWGVAIALVVSFLALGVLWTEPRLRRASTGRVLVPAGPALTTVRLIGQIVAFALYLICFYAGLFGLDSQGANVLPVTLYVTLWVGGQLVGGLIGDLWGAVNPLRTLAWLAERASRLLGRQPSTGPTTWGHWPATIGLTIFLFYELSHPTGSTPRTLGYAMAAHAAITVAAGFLWGAQWVVAHEPFTVFLAKLGAMGPLFGRKTESGGWSLGVRAPMSGLSQMEVKSGTVLLILVAIGGTSFDGFSESERGRKVFIEQLGLRANDWSLAQAEFGAMVISIALVALLYLIGVWWIASVTDMPFDRAWQEFAPSLVPIAFGYAVAHYFQLFMDESQSFVFRLSDPFGRGWDLFGGSDNLIWRIDPDITAWVQLFAILIGHIGAVLVAHDRAVESFPAGKSSQSQFAMLFVMVGYSVLGLWLLLTA